ncbi:DUF2846 domain-containing protein [Agaribacterium haliotis]|uniref:DUF2846 domain-containing protein n=1 Tax=Agaribacterium haliotis TaxID=2013869 RepID=UPI00117831EA|nr:DUF2846 domain-containing protein [Agaribacterium haliotis]
MKNITWPILIVYLVSLVGCATPPQGELFSEVNHPKPGMAKVYVYRPDTVGAHGLAPILIVGGKEVAKMPVNAYAEADVVPGYNSVVFDWPLFSMMPNTSYGFSFEEGKTYFIKFYVEDKGVVWFFSAEEIDPSVAVQEMATYRLSEQVDESNKHL